MVWEDSSSEWLFPHMRTADLSTSWEGFFVGVFLLWFLSLGGGVVTESLTGWHSYAVCYSFQYFCLAFLSEGERLEKLGYIVIYATPLTFEQFQNCITREAERTKLVWNPRLHSVSIL